MTSNKIEGYFHFEPPGFPKSLPFQGMATFNLSPFAGWLAMIAWQCKSRVVPRWSSVVTPLTCCAMQWSFPESRENPKLFAGWNLGTGHPFDNYYNQWYCNNQTVMVAILILDIISTFGELLWLHIIYIAYFPNCNLQLDNFHSSPILPGVMAWAA